MGEHWQIGVVAAVSAEEYRAGLIKKHELTRPDKENDRVNHIKYLAAQTGPVFLVYRRSPLLARLAAKAMTKERPAYAFTSNDGVEHAFYVVTDDRLKEELIKSFAGLDALYIADGHHRCAAALRAADAARSANPSHTGEEDYNYFLAVLFPDDQTHILAYHRVVKDLAGRSPAAFLDELRAAFQVEKLPNAREPRQKHEFSLYLAGDWYALTAQDFLYKEAGPVARLDVSLLQEYVLSPLLGITDPRADDRIDFVGGVRGLAELARLVDEGLYAAAFALYPTSMAEIMAIADAGFIMPPKSTWFEPKLRDALAIHLIEDHYLKRR
jgi:uncharacterized protein (DUF1015 family)